MTEQEKNKLYLRAPFSYFGGKSSVAEYVWTRFGEDVEGYVEPFMGSCAMLLGRPNWGVSSNYKECVNDKSGFVCLAPETKLLNGDLRWVQAGEVVVGQVLIGFDESNGPAREGFKSSYQIQEVAYY